MQNNFVSLKSNKYFSFNFTYTKSNIGNTITIPLSTITNLTNLQNMGYASNYIPNAFAIQITDFAIYNNGVNGNPLVLATLQLPSNYKVIGAVDNDITYLPANQWNLCY
jgi:Trk K+ transport system NAD-binding subunit